MRDGVRVMELDSDKRATFAARVHAIMEADGRGAYVPVSLVAKACSTALEELPQPEPVPGAAVRALVDAWRVRVCRESEGLRWAAGELEAALRADGLASAVLPTREELATAMYNGRWERDEAYVLWTGIGEQVQGNYLRMADVAIRMLARRPATDEAEALRKRTDEAEIAMWKRKVLDLESQLAAVTQERDRLSVGARNAYHDGYREAQSQKHAADERARVAKDERDEALAKLEELTAERDRAVAQDARSQDVLSRSRNAQEFAQLRSECERLREQRDTLNDRVNLACAEVDRLVAKLAALKAGSPIGAVHIYDQVEGERDAAYRELDRLREQLAARPEPVVITKLLATMAVAEYRGVEPRWVSGYDGDRMLAALTKTFGDRAGVSVPQGEPAHSLTPRLDAVTAERDKFIAECDDYHIRVRDLKAELALSERNAREWEAREAAATAELANVRRQLDEYRDAERQFGLPEDQTGEHLPLVMAARRMSTELEMRMRELDADAQVKPATVAVPALPIDPVADAEVSRLVQERSTGGRRPLPRATPEQVEADLLAATVKPLTRVVKALAVVVRSLSWGINSQPHNGYMLELYDALEALDARKGA